MRDKRTPTDVCGEATKRYDEHPRHCYREYPTRDKLTSPKTEWHNGAVVKELLARADEPGSTAGEAVFCFFIVQYFNL